MQPPAMRMDRPHAHNAIKAVELMGFSRDFAKGVLRRLLKTYEDSWELIVADNYNVFIDALIDQSVERHPQEDEEGGWIRKNREGQDVESTESDPQKKGEHPLPGLRISDSHDAPMQKRQRRELDATLKQHPDSGKCKLIVPAPSQPSVRPRAAEAVSPQASLIKKVPEASSLQPPPGSGRLELTPNRMTCRETAEAPNAEQENEEYTPLLIRRRGKRPQDEGVGNSSIIKEPNIEPGIEVPERSNPDSCYVARNELEREQYHSDSPLNEVPLAAQYHSDSPLNEVPLATMPQGLFFATANQPCEAGCSTGSVRVRPEDDRQSLAEQHANLSGAGGPSADTYNSETEHELARVQEWYSTSIDIASTASGEVKLSFTCSSNLMDFQMLSIEDVFKAVEDRCLKSYKFLLPDFSLKNLMKDMCQCVLELGSEPTSDICDSMMNVTPIPDSLKNSGVHEEPDISSNASFNLSGPQNAGPTMLNVSHSNSNGKIKEPTATNITTNSLVPVQQRRLTLPGDLREAHDASDISRGEERVRIPLDYSNEMLPSSFYYIPKNISYKNAYINLSLARVGDEDCCSDCYGDCLAAAVPCACARETGGEFAYTRDGLVKKKFLDECISTAQDPRPDRLFYCKCCPLERSKNEVMPGPCKGHVVRKFIKECWSKCGCNKQCGNRLVQRGITCNLQVFYTDDGKGFGVRTLDDLPRGTFVCEYVGEILTNIELYDRNLKAGNARHTYPVLLDADWGSECLLKDEDALCLDATFYGNVARFVNHRCNDANLIEIPVEIETPDHHYYHLAFFTTRKVEAFEELTWDYGIDFDDHTHPIKAFQCLCGSQYCRYVKSQKPRALKLHRSGR